MARMAETDFLQSMRFFVTVATAQGINPFQFTIEHTNAAGVAVEIQAGFSAVTTPEISVEVVEYHEGHHIYTHKFPGRPSVSDVTLSRGVAREDTDFFFWVLQAIEGAGEDETHYRTDLHIWHGGRAGLPNADVLAGPQTRYNAIARPTRYYSLFDAFPIRCKVAGDLDATSGDISISEVDVAYERLQVTSLDASGRRRRRR